MTLEEKRSPLLADTLKVGQITFPLPACNASSMTDVDMLCVPQSFDLSYS